MICKVKRYCTIHVQMIIVIGWNVHVQLAKSVQYMASHLLSYLFMLHRPHSGVGGAECECESVIERRRRRRRLGVGRARRGVHPARSGRRHLLVRGGQRRGRRPVSVAGAARERGAERCASAPTVTRERRPADAHAAQRTGARLAL